MIFSRHVVIALVSVWGITTTLAQNPTLPTLEGAPSRETLEAAITRAKDVVKQYQGGHVVVGRVVLDGPGDPRDVIAQMEILAGGYFVGATKDLVRPIGFRMHQYAPHDVDLKGFSGEVVDIGTIRMTKLPSTAFASLKGHIEFEGGGGTETASVKFSVNNGPVNTPNNGTSPRRHWPAPIQADVSVNGAVSALGFSPMEYYCMVTAPGFVAQSFPVNFKLGQVYDLGTIRLERPSRIALSYVVADEPPFDLSQKKQAVLSGGDRWKVTPDIYGWDLEFKQDIGSLLFDYSYGPCSLQDLGEGELADLVKVANAANPQESPHKQKVQSGHVYVVNQGHWKRWIVFRVDIQKN
jgi:hypothetical protein